MGLTPMALDDEKRVLQQEIEENRLKLQALQEEQAALLQQVKEEISLEKEEWETEKEKLQEAANKAGHDAGFLKGKEDSMERYATILSQANQLVEQTTKDYHKTLENSDKKIIELAIGTAEKIINQKILENESVFLDLVTTAIKEIKEQTIISLYLHPDNYSFVLEQKNELIRSLDSDMTIEIYIDQELNENGCLIKHPFGQVDVGVDTQLEQIQAVLQEVAMERKG